MSNFISFFAKDSHGNANIGKAKKEVQNKYRYRLHNIRIILSDRNINKELAGAEMCQASFSLSS